MERKGCESIIHDHDRQLWVTMLVGWVDVPYSDWGDFKRRRAVDISSFCVNWGCSVSRLVCRDCVGCLHTLRDVLWIVQWTFALFHRHIAFCICCILRDIPRCLYYNQRFGLVSYLCFSWVRRCVFSRVCRFDSPDVCMAVICVWSAVYWAVSI